VSVESPEALPGAHPIYFLDTDVFIESVKKTIDE
jgi:hypothetical protein